MFPWSFNKVKKGKSRKQQPHKLFFQAVVHPVLQLTVVDVNKPFMNETCTEWINYMRTEGKKE